MKPAFGSFYYQGTGTTGGSCLPAKPAPGSTGGCARDDGTATTVCCQP
jgi:hypothetical protein